MVDETYLPGMPYIVSINDNLKLRQFLMKRQLNFGLILLVKQFAIWFVNL